MSVAASQGKKHHVHYQRHDIKRQISPLGRKSYGKKVTGIGCLEPVDVEDRRERESGGGERPYLQPAQVTHAHDGAVKVQSPEQTGTQKSEMTSTVLHKFTKPRAPRRMLLSDNNETETKSMRDEDNQASQSAFSPNATKTSLKSSVI